MNGLADQTVDTCVNGLADQTVDTCVNGLVNRAVVRMVWLTELLCEWCG